MNFKLILSVWWFVIPWLLLMSMPNSEAATVTGSSVDVTFEVTYVTPTCDVSVPATYELSGLVKGTSGSAGTLSIDIQCSHVGLLTALTATTAHLVAGDDTKVELKLGTELTMNESDTDVVFDGTTAFCDSTQATPTKTCILNLDTAVAETATTGIFSVPVTFTQTYP